MAARPPRRAAGPVHPRLRRRVPGHRPRPGRAAAGARRRRPRPGRRRRPAPVDLRLPRAPRCAASSSSPDVPRRRRLAGRGRGAAHHPPVRPAPAAGRPAGRRRIAPAGHDPRGGPGGLRRTRWPRPARTATGGSRSAPSTPSGPRPSTSPTCCAGPTSRTASPGTTWRCWSAPAARPSRGLRRALGAAGVPVEVAGDDVPLVRDPAALPLLDALRAVLNLDNDDPDHVDYVDPAGPRRCCWARWAGSTPGDAAPARARCCGPARRPRPRPRSAHRDARASWCRAGARRPGLPRRARGARGRPGARLRRPAAGAGGRPRPTATPPRRCCGCCGPARRGPSGCAAGSRPAAPPPGGRTATSTRSCALFEAAARAEERKRPPRRRATSWPPWSPSRSRRHPGRARRPRGARCACSPRTAPRAWSGASSSSPTSSRRAGPTCGGARRCSRPTGSAPTALVPPVTHARAARRGAPAVLRRLHPRPAAPGRHGGGVARRRGRAALPVPRRARLDAGPPQRPARAGRCRWPAWSSELRRTVADPDTPPGAARGGGTTARPLAAESVGGRPLVPQADPPPGGAPAPPACPRARSAPPTSRCRSRPACSTGLMACPTQWFLSREAGGVDPLPPVGQPRPARARPRRAGRTGELAAGPDDVDVLMAARRRGVGPAGVPHAVGARRASTPGSGRRWRASCAWHHANPRELVGIEEQFATVVDLPDGEQVRLGGYADRLEVDARRPGRGGRPQDRPHHAVRRPPSSATSSSRSTSSPSTAAPSTRSCPTPALAAAPCCVQLGALDDTAAAVEQRQDPQPDDVARSARPARRPVRRPPADLRREEFPAVPGDHCKDCPFVRCARPRAPDRW